MYTLNNPYKYVDKDGNVALTQDGYGNVIEIPPKRWEVTRTFKKWLNISEIDFAILIFRYLIPVEVQQLMKRDRASYAYAGIIPRVDCFEV
jgi:hypothetical protein